MVFPDSVQHNLLIAALPAAEQAAWQERLEPMLLSTGDVLHQPGSRLDHVWFPISAVVSLLHGTPEGASSEVALVGHEGLVGTWLLMGDDAAPGWALVHGSGLGYRAPSAWLIEEFERNGALRVLLLHYTQALTTQIAQTAVCNRHHSLLQRLGRWLLQNLEQVPGDELLMTHELIASLLGVRREGVSEALGRLQHAGVIRCARGQIQVLDRAGLERQACDCCGLMKQEYERLLPALPALRPGSSARPLTYRR